MPVQFKITISKKILERSKYCGTDTDTIGNNCAIAIALMNIFPDVYVTNDHIFPMGTESEKGKDLKIPMPVIAQQFIKLFDGFRMTPKLRLMLPEFEFTVDIPDAIIEQINIDEVRELIKEGKKITSVCKPKAGVFVGN